VTYQEIKKGSANKAWIPELIAAAGPEITESYIDFFTSGAVAGERLQREADGPFPALG
jgi:hypothetical protein